MTIPCSSAGPFARGSAGAVGAVRLGVVGECQLVGLELLEGDVSRVGVGDQRDPLLAWELVQGDLPVRGAALFAPAIDERARVSGVVQSAQHSPVTQRHPHQLAFALPGAHAGGEQQPVGGERLHDRARRPGPRERLEQATQRVLDTGVGIERDPSCRVIDQPNRERCLQLAAAGFGEDPALQPGADEVQLGL
jgi:hypothetical protein